MTAAPAYTWSFAYDLWGDRVPKVVTMEIANAACVKVGTLMSQVSGYCTPTTDGTGQYIFGIAAETISTAPAADDPVRVEVIGPGMVIKGTAVDTAASTAGFTSKVQDLDADGRLDPDDVTGGGLTVLRTEDSGLTIWCLVTKGACFG